MLAYLCTPMDAAGDTGTLWRRKLAPFLRDQLGHRVFDPVEDSRKCLSDEEAANFAAWQTTDLDRFRRAARRIVAFDLDLLEHKADYLICLWDANSPRNAGAPAEVVVAHRKGIPVYLVAPLPVEQINSWVLGCSDQVFSSVEDLKDYLAARFAREKQTHLWKD